MSGSQFSVDDLCVTEEFPAPELLYKFVQSVADLSVNELTIHSLGSSTFVLEDPYKSLHDLIMVHTKYWSMCELDRNFYKRCTKGFKVKVFEQIVEQDFATVKSIVLPCTVREMGEMKRRYLAKYLQFYIQKRFKQFVGSSKATECVPSPYTASGQTQLSRFVREIAGGSATKGAEFCIHFTATEPEICMLYEDTVFP